MLGPTIERLRRAFDEPLPGVEGQLRMSPRPRHGWSPNVFPDDARDGAGLLLVYPGDDGARIVLTERHAELAHHAGQVSLPGGRLDGGETLWGAALRETEEEIGVDPAAVRRLGELTRLHIPVSRFILHPFVGWIPERPEFRPSAIEVERLIEIDLERLADPAVVRVERWDFSFGPVEVPLFDVAGATVWGATAMVLAEFLSLLGCAPDPFGDLDGGP